jgi:hypothetical protein
MVFFLNYNKPSKGTLEFLKKDLLIYKKEKPQDPSSEEK